MSKVQKEMWPCGRPMGKYRGIYPLGIIERIKKLIGLPDGSMILHQFGGSTKNNDYEHTVDINPEMNPTYNIDARNLEGIKDEYYDLVIADPPYDTDGILYGPALYKTEAIKPYSFVEAGLRVLKPGGYYVILHHLVYFTPKNCTRYAVIGITTGPNMRIRCLNIFIKSNVAAFQQKKIGEI